jgi:hypothetical protein
VRQQQKITQAEFHTTWARCRTPNQIQAPTTVQRMGQGLISMWTGELFSKFTVCSGVFIVDMFMLVNCSLGRVGV